MQRVLVTGAASWLGKTVVSRLANRPQIEVFAADRQKMDVPVAVDRYQGGIDRLSFAEYLLEVRPHAVIHLAPIDRKGSPGAVAGAQALFGAIGRCAETETVIVKSDTSVYGSGPRSPSVFSEKDIPAHGKQLRFQRRLSELEAFVEEVAARQPATKYAVLRFATIIGPTIGNAMSRYLRLPAVPVLGGFDPRLQFIYEQDAVRSILHALDYPQSGVINVTADGQLYLSRILRLGGRLPQPMPGRAFRAVRKGLGAMDIELTEDMEALLRYGRVVDTTRMTAEFEFTPALNCRQSVMATYERIPRAALPQEVTVD